MLLLARNKSFKNVSIRAGGPCDGRLNASACFRRKLIHYLPPNFHWYEGVKDFFLLFAK